MSDKPVCGNCGLKLGKYSSRKARKVWKRLASKKMRAQVRKDPTEAATKYRFSGWED